MVHPRSSRLSTMRVVAAVCAACLAIAWSGRDSGPPSLVGGAVVAAAQDTQEPPPRVDYLTFAQGAVPVGIGGPGASMGPNAEHQIRLIDGDPTGFGFIVTEDFEVVTEFTYELPAPTTFDRFAVPQVLEVPSPRQTFTRYVEVLGSPVGPDEEFVLLASATLETHSARGQVTELDVVATPAVRWVRLRLRGGIDVLADTMSFDFSEIIGNGSQEAQELADRFTGAWDSQFVKMELVQDGPQVSGCYDTQGLLEGTVDGRVLRARGVDQGRAQTVSLFVLTVLADGTLTGVRSTNNGLFRLYTGGAVEDVAQLDCLQPPAPIGCGSVVYGITFGFD